MTALGRSARFVAWANATLVAGVSPDEAALQIRGDDPPHRVDGLPLGDGQSLTVVLAWLARVSGWSVRLVLPVPGDPIGLPGPGPLAIAALAGGEAAVLSEMDGPSYGLVPNSEAGLVRWTAYAVESQAAAVPAPLPSLAEADRGLAIALREATEQLSRLDVARLPPGGAESLAALRDGHLDGAGLAPGYPPRAYALLVRARRLRVVSSLAFADDGGAITAAEASARRDVLEELERAARHAETAAYNAVFEERTARSG